MTRTEYNPVSESDLSVCPMEVRVLRPLLAMERREDARSDAGRAAAAARAA